VVFYDPGHGADAFSGGYTSFGLGPRLLVTLAGLSATKSGAGKVIATTSAAPPARAANTA
jgi:hypothetical protein